MSASKLTRRARPTKETLQTQTSSSSSSSSSLRIRDNQRRSRARRKEYIHDLEQRLRAFEAAGVQATQEVQAAGRRVAAENALLRSLLRLRGISDQEVEGYLAGHRADFDALPAAVPPGAGPMPKERSHVEGRESESLGPTGASETETPWQPTPTPTSSDGERRERMASLPATDPQVVDSERPVPVSSLIHDISNPQPSLGANGSSGQSTPCETAARIITSMHSYTDARDVRSELGCESGSECMVRNMDIFQLLDG